VRSAIVLSILALSGCGPESDWKPPAKVTSYTVQVHGLQPVVLTGADLEVQHFLRKPCVVVYDRGVNPYRQLGQYCGTFSIVETPK
jgi:hypothetical protein